MSSKSDNDNRSNQLNPNNERYQGGGRESDDSDSDCGGYRKRFMQPYEPTSRESIEEYFMVLVTFSGYVRYIKFKTKSQHTSSHKIIAASIRHEQELWIKDECNLGMAFMRIACPKSHVSNFYWFAPKLNKRDMEKSDEELLTYFKRLDIDRARAWFGSAREIALKYEKIFEWLDHKGCENFGEFTEELEYFGKNPYKQ